MAKTEKNDQAGPAPKRKKVELQCLFWLAQKRRFCAMQRQSDRLYCLEHIKHDPEALEARVPCPLDGKHSVWARDLASHLKKCPARPEKPPAWFRRNCNSAVETVTEAEPAAEATAEIVPAESDEAAEDQLLATYTRLVRQFGTTSAAVERQIGGHKAIVPAGGKEQLRHMTQQAALAGLLESGGMLLLEVFYVEFGCGKAELSRTVNECVVYEAKGSPSEPTGADSTGTAAGDTKTADSNSTSSNPSYVYGYGLIDRGVNRMKADSKLARFAASANLFPKVLRSRIDIEHLDLAKFLAEIAPPPAPLRFVGISKHLCGVATDLTLTAIVNAKVAPERFDGMVVAMCCRHACIWDRLLPESQKFLAKYGFGDSQAFSVIKRIATWAVCGGVSPEKVQLGHWARTLVDRSRVHAIGGILGPEYVVELFQYAESETTLENQCMRIRRA